ncbi:hypothetical protein F2P79_008441 [Pimephales promelas]|nr:hypothetical protein F2P79_008441 [Pimephales promelas]
MRRPVCLRGCRAPLRLSLLFSLLSEDHLGLLHPLSKTISTAMNSTRQDLDAIHTEHDIVHDKGFLESTAEGIKA